MNISYLTNVSRLVLGTVAKMAESNRDLSNENIKMSVKGTLFSKSTQLTVKLENEKYLEDSANVSIHIEIKNFLTGEYVKGPYNSTLNWITYEELEHYWTFMIISRIFKPQFVKMYVTVNGINDDIGLYIKKSLFGCTIGRFIFLIPV